MIDVTAPRASADTRTPRVFGKILVAVREGAELRHTVATAARLAAWSGARVRVLHLQERVTHPTRAGVPLELESYKHAMEFASAVKAEMREYGVHAEVEVGKEQTGREAEQILQAADQFDADLIVAGNHHKTALDRLLRGSTTRDVVRKSDVALLLIPLGRTA